MNCNRSIFSVALKKTCKTQNFSVMRAFRKMEIYVTLRCLMLINSLKPNARSMEFLQVDSI